MEKLARRSEDGKKRKKIKRRQLERMEIVKMVMK